jgi:hypothetical protein
MQKNQIKTIDLTVNISDIDLRPDGPFCMSFAFDLDILKESISKYGILNPPYLIKNLDDSFSVVAGYRRLLAANELGWKNAECRLLPEGFPAFDALMLNLDDNLLHRKLNIIEKGMVIKRIFPFLKKEKIITDYLALLDIPASKQNLELYLKLSELDEQIKVSIAKETLSLRVVDLMGNIDRENRLSINDLFISLKYSFNQQLQLFQYVTEISSREGRSIKKILDDSEIIEVLTDKRTNAPQKGKAITVALKKRRFPLLSEAERTFKKGLSRLSLPSGVNIIPPAFFEGVNYRLEIVFSNGKELTDKLNKLNSLSGLFEVTEFWRGRGNS